MVKIRKNRGGVKNLVILKNSTIGAGARGAGGAAAPQFEFKSYFSGRNSVF